MGQPVVQLPVAVSVGSTDTSLWTHYNAGEREYCGNIFPDGMRKNDKLEQQVITPTTKAVAHDVPISAHDILEQGILSQQDWDQVDHKHSLVILLPYLFPPDATLHTCSFPLGIVLLVAWQDAVLTAASMVEYASNSQFSAVHKHLSSSLSPGFFDELHAI